jgi:cation transport regulator ChaC
MLHFAYGSNMSVPMMRRRCPAVRLEGRALLPGYRFVITREGYASILSAPGGRVHGVLWRLTPRDLAALNAYENLGELYRAVTMTVVGNRRRVAALVYVGRSQARGRPRPGYMDIVTAACYVRNLARLAKGVSKPGRYARAAKPRKVSSHGE